jgi:hypothetical protein
MMMMMMMMMKRKTKKRVPVPQVAILPLSEQDKKICNPSDHLMLLLHCEYSAKFPPEKCDVSETNALLKTVSRLNKCTKVSVASS